MASTWSFRCFFTDNCPPSCLTKNENLSPNYVGNAYSSSISCMSPFMTLVAMLLRWETPDHEVPDSYKISSALQAVRKQFMILFAACWFSLEQDSAAVWSSSREDKSKYWEWLKDMTLCCLDRAALRTEVIVLGSKHIWHNACSSLKGMVFLSLMGSLSSHQFVNKKVIC